MKAKVIPAAPGFEVLMALAGYLDEFVVLRNPVIAWRIYPGGHCAAVTAIEIDDGDERAILCPDGKILDHDENYRRATYAEWEAEQIREWQARRAEHAEPTEAEITQGYADAAAAMAEIATP